MTALPSADSVRLPGRPSVAQSAQLEQHILDVAWEVLATQGIDSLTIDAIAARGRLSKTTIYARFRGKEALVGAVIEQRSRSYLDLIFEPITEPGLRHQIRELAARAMSLLLTPEGAVLERLIVSESHRYPAIRQARRSAFLRARVSLTEKIIREGNIPAHHAIEVGFLSDCWIRMLTGHTNYEIVTADGPLDIDAHVADHADRFADVFMRLLAPLQPAR